MHRFDKVWTIALIGAAVASGGAALAADRAQRAGSPAATPPGITLQRIGERTTTGQGAGGYVYHAARRLAYGAADGMTLYFSDKDVEAGKPTCTSECTKTFAPLIAGNNARPAGDWSLVARDDGTRQWAVAGKPLYRYADEKRAGETGGNSLMEGTWHAAVYEPGASMKLPYGMIGVQEVAEASGQVLVDGNGKTLYALSGRDDRQPLCAGNCNEHFTPLLAGFLVKPAGDFTIERREDGTKQWAFKGKRLYSYDLDFTRGDVYGVGRDKRWEVAYVERYFMPAEASLNQTLKGVVLSSAEGITLYRLDGYAFDASGGYSLHRAIPLRPAVGREIGWKSCVAECLQSWRPLKAPADALPSGYWEIATRDDGTRQWVYQGYPMYTFIADKKPGDMAGNDKFQFMISDDPKKVAYAPTLQNGAGALYWAYVVP